MDFCWLKIRFIQLDFSNLIFPTWFFKNLVQINRGHGWPKPMMWTLKVQNSYQPHHFCILLFCRIFSFKKISRKSKLFNVKVVEVEIVHFGYGLKSLGLQCLSAFSEKEIEVASLVQGLLLATGRSRFLECKTWWLLWVV